jgi:hypothetical protein
MAEENPDQPGPEFHRSADAPQLCVYDCPLCGAFVAASPNPELIALAVSQHSCGNAFHGNGMASDELEDDLRSKGEIARMKGIALQEELHNLLELRRKLRIESDVVREGQSSFPRRLR